jgi:hypothetical protein
MTPDTAAVLRAAADHLQADRGGAVYSLCIAAKSSPRRAKDAADDARAAFKAATGTDLNDFDAWFGCTATAAKLREVAQAVQP